MAEYIEMAEYIDREELKKAIDTWDKFYYVPLQGIKRGRNDDYEAFVYLSDILHCIDNIPPTDVQPIKYGRWELTNNPSFRKCSVCGAWWSSDITDNCFTNYCPKCGARMDAEPDEPWQSK